MIRVRVIPVATLDGLFFKVCTVKDKYPRFRKASEVLTYIDGAYSCYYFAVTAKGRLFREDELPAVHKWLVETFGKQFYVENAGK